MDYGRKHRDFRPTRSTPLYLTWSPFPIPPQHGEDAKREEGKALPNYYPRVICLVQVILPAHLSMAINGWMGFSPYAGPASLAFSHSPGDQVG